MKQVLNDWRDRAQLLLQAVKDVAPHDHPRKGSMGSSHHHELFKEYVEELYKHKQEGEKWLESLVDSEERRTGDRSQAITNVMERRPIGALSYPYVTGTVRKFWLACVALNEQLPPLEKVAPEEFALEWLMQQGYDDLAEFISGYPYWPIGLNGFNIWV
jgi:hypothetical protein